MPLMRLAYASEATFEPKPVDQGVEPHVARILMTSRRNNGRCDLMGGLYYGDNRFFQYLEGDEQSVRKTYERIKGDTRHRNLTKLIEEPLEKRTFSNWSMKYVPLSSDVRKFLATRNLESFDPVSFSLRQCEEMIELIRSSSHSQKLVDRDDGAAKAQQKVQAYSPALRMGLLAAAACLLGALVFAGTML